MNPIKTITSSFPFSWDSISSKISLPSGALEKIINTITSYAPGLITGLLTYNKLPQSSPRLLSAFAALGLSITTHIIANNPLPKITSTFHSLLDNTDSNPGIAAGSIFVGAAAGASGYLPAGTLEAAMTASTALIAPEASLAAGAFSISTATSSALSHYSGLGRSSRSVQLASMGATGALSALALTAGAGPALAIGSTASAVSMLFLLRSPIHFVGSKAISWGGQYLSKFGSSALNIAKASTPNVIKKAAFLAKDVSTVLIPPAIFFAIRTLYNNPSITESLPSLQETFDNIKDKPLETIQSLGTNGLRLLDQAASEGFKKTAEAIYNVAANKTSTYYNATCKWVEEDGFEYLIQLPLYITKFTTKTLNSAVRSGPHIAAEVWNNATWPLRGLLAFEFSLLAYLMLKRPPPSKIKFISASLIPRTIRNISDATKQGIRKGIQKLEPYSRFAKPIHTYLFPQEPKPIFSEKLTKELNTLKTAIEQTKAHDGYLSNLLLEGPPGTGKTMVAEYLASQAKCHLITMKATDLLSLIGCTQETRTQSKWPWSSSDWKQERNAQPHMKKLHEIFAFSKNEPHWMFWLPHKIYSLCTPRIPTIWVIDEFDLLVQHREDLAQIDPKRVEILYEIMAATGSPSKDLMIIGTTNRVANIDTAILDRFSGTTLRIDLPEQQERASILREHINHAFPEHKHPERATCLNEKGIERIAALTQGLSGRSLVYLVSQLRTIKSQTENNLLTSELIEEKTRSFVKNTQTSAKRKSSQQSSSSILQWMNNKLLG